MHYTTVDGLRKKEVVYSQISLYRLKTCIICCSTRSPVWFFVTPWTAARQASLASIISWSLLRFMSIESVMLSNYLIPCCPLLRLPSVFSSIRVFANEFVLHIRWPEYWSFSFSISPFNEYSGLISFRNNLSTWKIFSKYWITFRSSESGGNGKFSRFSTLSLGVRLAQTSLRFQCSGKMAVITHQDWYITGYIH